MVFSTSMFDLIQIIIYYKIMLKLYSNINYNSTINLKKNIYLLIKINQSFFQKGFKVI